MQCELVAVCDDRVAGVGATGIAAHHVEVAGDEIGNLALALVPPLRSNKH